MDAIRGRGFTLIELLMVISIIALLFAMLFPVFAAARESGRRAGCQSNLKQLGMAVQLYRDDYNDAWPIRFMPKSERAGVREGFAEYCSLIYPYVRNGKEERSYPDYSRFNGGVYHCPSDDGYEGPSYAINAWLILLPDLGGTVPYPDNTIILAEKRGSIPQEQFAWYLTPWPRGAPSVTEQRERSINSIDRDFWGEPIDDESPTSDETREAAGVRTMRHFGGANYLFGDGHVKWSKLAGVWGNGTTTNQFWPSEPGR